MENIGPPHLDFEGPSTRKLVDMRAERCVRDVISHLKDEVRGMGEGNPGGRCGLVVVMLRTVIKQQVEWLNVRRGEGRSSCLFPDGDLYAYFLVLFIVYVAPD